MAKLSVSRTLITVEGRVEDDIIATIDNATDERDFVDLRHAYDETTNQTNFWLYPCKTYVIEYGDGDDSVESCERKIIMKGNLPKSLHFIADHWMPFRKQAKRSDDNARYVALTIKDVFKKNPQQEQDSSDYTEFSLIVDCRCPEDERSEVLNRAANFVCDELRNIVESSKPAFMQSVHAIDKVSCDVADILADLLP